MGTWIKRLLFFLAFAGAAGAAVLFGPSLYEEVFGAKEDIPVFTVKKTSFVRKVTAEGNLRATKATPIVAPMEADRPLKISWMAEDGSYVEKDEVIIRFDSTEMLTELENGQDERLAVEVKTQKEKLASRMASQEKELATYLAELELEKTKQFQNKDPEIFSRNQIIESEIDGELSAARMEHAEASKKIEQSLSRSKLDLLAIEKRKAQLVIEKAQKGLEALEVKAPHAGIITFRKGWRGESLKVGSTVWSGQPLGEIPLLEEMEAEVFVLEVDAAGLEEGRLASVVVEAHPETVYEGKVKRVDTLPKPRQRGAPVQYFGLTVALSETDKEVMKPGQRVRATLVLDENEALVVPRQTIFDKEGVPTVYKQEGEDFVPVKVELGASSPGLVVIKSGLSEGDRIALRDPTRSPNQGEEKEKKTKTGPSVLAE